MTVRRVSRRRRRHLRKTRVQRGGDRTPQDANEWASEIKSMYDPANSTFRNNNNEIIIDKLAGQASITDTMHISIKNQEYSLMEVAARVAVFMFNFINKEEHTYATYDAWYVQLESDELTRSYKTTLLDIENALRNLVQLPNLTEPDDIGRVNNYPLYVWALVFSIPSKSASEAAENLAPDLFSEENVQKRITEIKAEAVAEEAKKAAEFAAEATSTAANLEAQLPQLGEVSTQKGPASQEE